MPKIEDILAKKEKKQFKKKEYRPWDLGAKEQEASAPSPSEEKIKTETKKPKEAKKSDIINKPVTNQTQTGHKMVTSPRPTPGSAKQKDDPKKTATKINRTQTGHKPDTNRSQSGHKPDTQPDTNETQTRHKLVTAREPLDGIVIKKSTKGDTNRTQTGHETGHVSGHKPDTNRSREWLKNNIASLSGIQRDILFFLHLNAQHNTPKITDKLNRIHIAEAVECKKSSVKTSIYRLEEKGFIVREDFWDGRGGWSRYSVPAEIHTQLVEYQNSSLKIKPVTKPDTNRTQTGHKPDTQPNTQPNTSGSSSSSKDIDLKNTTTTELPEEWQEINCEPLKHINFGKSQLIQLHKLGMHPGVVQDSINHFAFDLSHNKKQQQIRSGALPFFVGILRREGCYNAPDNYISPREKALRQYAENQKREQDRITQLEKEAKAPHYQQWVNNLTTDQEKEILPPEILNSGLSGMKTSALQSHFNKEVWPEIRKKLNIPE